MAERKIIIASDHAGYKLKNELIKHYETQGIELTDIGCYSEDSCDYPIIAKNAAQEILNKKARKAILVCGTGIGMAMMANRYKGIRAAVVSDTCSAKMSRSHNDANILCIGARILGFELAKDIVEIWLNTEFQGNRHTKRVIMMDEEV